MAGERRRSWRRLTTVRARTTLAATVVVGLALGVTTLGLVAFLRQALVHQIDDVADVHAQNIAALARQGTLPADLAVHGDDGDVVQVVDDGGRVVAATAGLPRDRPLAHFRPSGLESQARTVDNLPLGGDRSYRVVALRTATPAGPVTIYVAASLGPVEDAIGVLEGALAVGTPVLLVLVALTTWTVVGRALRPVEAIRTEVADISASSLDRRVPAPPADDEIGRLAGTMNMMLDRLEEAADRQRRFVADASHELQTPLASMRTDLEVALAHPAGTEWTATAADLLAANQRMERLVGDLLFLARADDPAAHPTVDRRPPPVLVDLDDVVAAEVARLSTAGRVRVDTAAVSAAAVTGRRDELSRVVRNVLDNAGHHAVSVVTVTLSTVDSWVTLAVADDGPGIPPADRDRVFERFTRLDDARSRARGGTGLGLAIAKEIVEAHRGTIVVADVPAGTRMVITLPAS